MSLHGVGALTRLALRRDRVLLPVSLVAVVGLMAASVQATIDLYPDGQVPQSLLLVYRQPVSNGMYGVLPAATYDALMVHKPALSSLIVLVVVAVVLVRRHTRGDEEAGRLELVMSGSVGRLAPLAAATAVAAGWVAATVLATMAALAGLGLDVTGSVALALAWLGLGWVAVGVTAVAAQLTTSARTTAGLAAAVMGGWFVLRIVGSVVESARWVSWLTPWGWVEQARAFGANRVWVGALGVLLAAALVGMAVVLQARRDLGAGLIPDRRGAASAPAWMSGPLTLAARLARGTVVAWTLGVLVMGAVGGSLVGSVAEMFDDPALADLVRRMGGGSDLLTDAYAGMYLRIIGIAAAAVGVALTLRLRSEEEDGRVELLVAAPVSRWRVVAAHAVVGLVGGVIVLLAGSLAFGATAAGSGGPGMAPVLRLGLLQTPAVVVMVGVAVLLVGLVPRWSVGLTWSVLAYGALSGELGSLLRLPNAALQLSPWHHLPVLSGSVPRGVWVLVVLGVALGVVGLMGYRRRDIPT